MSVRLLLIDNYDSFTYNLVQAFLVLEAEVLVYRNDALSVAEAEKLKPTHLVISPGPGPARRRRQLARDDRRVRGQDSRARRLLGAPEHRAALRRRDHRRGGADARQDLARAARRRDDLSQLSNPFEVGRYHSLAANREKMPPDLIVTARTTDGEIMGVRHRQLDVEGVQFHPESVLTPEGPHLLKNFLYP